MKKLMILATTVTLAGAAPALAHTGHTETSGFLSGLMHPIGGLDHILAMVAVGVWAALIGGKRSYLWPISFVGAMVVGFALSAFGLSVPLIEPGILASVVVLGLLIAAAAPVASSIGCAIIALFAVFHGAAHGLEAPGGSLMGYAVGFALATAGLHMVGLGFGTIATSPAGRWVLRLAGGASAAGGLALAFAA